MTALGRPLHVMATWLIAWMTVQTFGQVLSPDGILAFVRTKYRS